MNDQTPYELMMPQQEADLVRDEYARAEVILEYGAGGSTVVGAAMPGGHLFSVESDADWLAGLARWFEANPPARQVHLHHADIGPTRKFGYPTDETAWRQFPSYPLGVWDRPDFVHPDVVLVDGRFRVACFLATLFRIERPVTLLFDDYAPRASYHKVERYARPTRHCGRMAAFDLAPKAVPARDLAWIMSLFTRQK